MPIARISARAIRHLVTPGRYGLVMSRPKVYDEPRVATAVRLPLSLHGELQSAASVRDVSVNLLITRAVSAYLAGLPPAEDEAATGDRRPS
jgi:hypothetical protein